MTKIWFAAARPSVRRYSRPPPSAPRLSRFCNAVWTDSVRVATPRAALRSKSPPQPLDARLLADGEALEAAWQAEIRAMIAARRGGARP